MLEEEGYKPIIAGDYDSAFVGLKDEPFPDLVIVGVGYRREQDFADYLSKHNGNTPVILTYRSENDNVEKTEERFGSGRVYEIFEGPIIGPKENWEPFLSTVKSCLDEHKSQ